MSAAPRAIVAETGLYIHTTAYGVVLGGLIVLVPLYIISLGYNPAWLGLIIAGQGLFQVAVRLFGGVIADRIGERWVIQTSFAALVVGSLGLAFLPTLFALLLAQVLFGASRAIYWTSSQSYGSRIDESRPTTLIGRFFGFAAVGGLAGNAGGGFVAVVLGYQEGFLIAGGISAGAMLVVAMTPQLPRQAAMTLREILRPVPGVFRNRATVLPAGMALATSVQVAALSSVGAALYKGFGFDDDAFGVLMATHALGAIIAGFAFARFLRRVGQRPTYALTLVTHGLPLIAVVLWGGDYPVAVVLMFILGLSFNAGRVLNVSLAAIASTPEQRGVFMAVVGIYWAFGQMLGPLLFGPLAAFTSLSASVTVMGAVMIGTALLTPLLYAASGGKSEGRAESAA